MTHPESIADKAWQAAHDAGWNAYLGSRKDHCTIKDAVSAAVAAGLIRYSQKIEEYEAEAATRAMNTVPRR